LGFLFRKQTIWQPYSANQGDPMSLWQSRPKSSPIYFFVKINK
jgi:hypothetical protein